MNRLLICPKGSRREGWKGVKPVIIDCQIDKMYIKQGQEDAGCGVPEGGYYFFDCRVIRSIHFACYLMHNGVFVSL